MKEDVNFKTEIFDRFKKYGSKDAIRYERESISYINLKREIERLSDTLVYANFTTIAICIDNKMKVLILALSCIVAGIPFIVIDKTNPISFLESILQEANISTIICDEILKVKNCNCVLLNKLNREEGSYDKKIKQETNNVLFFIATSGSTGKPKVAERFTESFWDDYKEFECKFPFLFGQVAQQYAKLNFSYGLENSLLLLIGGTTLCLGGLSSGVKDLNLMYREINYNQASIVFWATPIIKLLSKHYRLFEGMPGCIKYIYTGGEPLVVSADLIVEFRNRDIALINDYGCSEIGKVFANPYRIKLRDMQAFNMVGVGKALKEYEAVIMDENLNEVDEGYLYLKSEKRFLCSYVNKSIKTNEIKKDNYWLYNMHDIAKKEDGEIIILGREINSVNIAGYRIELEQVEYAVNQLKGIKSCIAIPIYNQYREVSLFCFYQGSINCQDIRFYLYDIIPSYMIPNVFVPVDRIFLLPNGKVDRKKNKELYGDIVYSKSVASREVKGRIYQYLKRIVGNDLGDFDDIYLMLFSDLGVDSLSMVDFISTVEEKEKVLITSDGIGTRIKCLKDVIDLVNTAKTME